MKKHLLLTAFIVVSSLQLFSQDSLANMFEIGNKWSRFGYTHWMAPPNFISEEVVADTMIHGLRFAKVKSSFYAFSDAYKSYVSYSYKGQQNNTVHYYEPNGDSIIKLYSFSGLKLGDTLTLFNNQYTAPGKSPFTIDSSDFIKIGDKDIKRFRISTYDISTFPNKGKDTTIVYRRSIYFYDGIGSEGAGIEFAPVFNFESNQYLACIERNHKVYVHKYDLGFHNFYSDTLSECKFKLLGIDDKTHDAQITLSRISEDQLLINTEANLLNAQLTMYDTRGNMYLCGLEKNMLDISPLKDGLYILKIQTADHQLASLKFVK